MSTLELPLEIAEKVVGMVKVKGRPFGVLIVEDCRVGDFVKARIHEEAVSQAERVALRFRDIKQIGVMRWWIRNSSAEHGGVEELVYAALSLGFAFRGEADRDRWKQRQPFEMYRDAVRELV